MYLYVYTEFALDALFIHIVRNCIVDIQKGNRVLTHYCSNELA